MKNCGTTLERGRNQTWGRQTLLYFFLFQWSWLWLDWLSCWWFSRPHVVWQSRPKSCEKSCQTRRSTSRTISSRTTRWRWDHWGYFLKAGTWAYFNPPNFWPTLEKIFGAEKLDIGVRCNSMKLSLWKTFNFLTFLKITVSFHFRLGSYVVYFDQQMGAPHAICWSKSIF